MNPPVLYISTPHHNRVRVVDINSRKTWTVGGWGRLNQDGIGTYARFAEPHGLGIDWHSSNPRLLLADRDNNQIRLITRRTPNVRKMTRKGECTSSNRCGLCEADCDNDSQCVAGTKCFQRDGLTPVPGCLGGTNGDDSGADYCTDAPSVTRYPTPAPIALPPMSKVMDKSNANVQTVARIYYARYMDCDWSIGDCIVSSWHVNKLHRVVGGFHVSPQVIETVGTGSRTWRDGVFSVASFDHPGRPVLYGTVSYHPDYYDHRIRKIDWAAKMVYTVTRSGSGHRDGPVSVARFHYPTVMEKRTAPGCLSRLERTSMSTMSRLARYSRSQASMSRQPPFGLGTGVQTACAQMRGCISPTR